MLVEDNLTTFKPLITFLQHLKRKKENYPSIQPCSHSPNSVGSVPKVYTPNPEEKMKVLPKNENT
jgi:hypothetical protein